MNKRIRKKKAKQAETWEEERRRVNDKYVAKIVEEAVSRLELIMRRPTITAIVEKWINEMDKQHWHRGNGKEQR